MKLLVIDDNKMTRQFLSDALASFGYDVVLAANGREGLAAYAREGADCVVTDLYMPDRDGIEVLLELRQINPALPIVVMSAGGSFVQSDELGAAQLLGATSVLRKPFGVAQLRSQLDGILRGPDTCPARDT